MSKVTLKDRGKSNKEVSIIWSETDDPTIQIWSNNVLLRELNSARELENGVGLELPDEFIIYLKLIRRPWLLADKVEMTIDNRKIYSKVRAGWFWGLLESFLLIQ